MRSLLRRRRDDRGAVAPLVAIMFTVLLMIAALVVDIGMQRVGRADMQALADVVALDLARELDGNRDVGELEALEQTLANASRDRNRSVVGYDDHLPEMDVEWGEVDSDGTFARLTDAAAIPTAVRVRADTEVGFAFAGITGNPGGSANRKAVAEVPDRTMCFQMGSFAAALSLGQSIVGDLTRFLGLEGELSLISYERLLGADVSLADIAASPGIGSPSALLDPSGVTVGQLLDATIFALQHGENSTGTGLALDVLQQMVSLASEATLSSRVVLSDVVGVDIGDTASLAAKLNVLELIGASLALANEENFVASEIPVNLSSLGLGTGKLAVSAIQGPRMACGKPDKSPGDDCEVIRARQGACTTQSQIDFSLAFEETVLQLVPPSALGDGFKATVGPISLTGGVGNAKGVLTSIDTCGPPDELSVRVSSGLLGVNLSVPITLGGSLTIPIGQALLDPLNDVLGGIPILGNLLDVILGGGLLGGTQYGHRNYTIKIELEEVGVNVGASSEGSTDEDTALLQSPRNDRGTGVPVKVPDPPKAPSLKPISLPSDVVNGQLTVSLSYEERTRKVTLLGIPITAWTPWEEKSAALPVNLANLGLLPGVLGTTLGPIQAGLNGLVSGLNTQVVNVVNDTFNSTLLPLLGLSGAGADLYSVPRTGSCGGIPQLVD